jgi:hypothetical protein
MTNLQLSEPIQVKDGGHDPETDIPARHHEPEPDVPEPDDETQDLIRPIHTSS